MPRLVRHERCDSTSERAFAALADGTARDADVHVAREQTAGRGRLGRSWESPPGAGLYLSWIHLPERPASPPLFTMAAGVAVLRAVEHLGLQRTRLDWPNDLVVGPAKLAGCLVESRGLDPASPHYVVGIGLNVLQDRFPEALTRERAVTSLVSEGLLVTIDEALSATLTHLGQALERVHTEPRELCMDYLSATSLVGQTVELRTGSEVVSGVPRALDPDRGLTIETAQGTRDFNLAHVLALNPLSTSI